MFSDDDLVLPVSHLAMRTRMIPSCLVGHDRINTSQIGISGGLVKDTLEGRQ